MTTTPNNPNTPDDVGPPPRDELDAMLRTWHDANAQRAAAGRDRLVRTLAQQTQEQEQSLRLADHPAVRTTARPSPFVLLRNIAVNPYSRLAASVMILAVLITLLIPTPGNRAMAQDNIIMVPEGGMLQALDDEGNLIGPCPLKDTVVNVEVSGFFSRVSIKQTYQNPYKKKIEAVYTFPMSHRAAVDRMTMTVGDRVVVGEVKEREKARQIYEAARAQGYVASLLEQERPNIFTQSIANIEPEAQVIVEISYVEVLESKDGQYTFDFPMVVGPRYIPGAPMTSPAIVPAELAVRHGVMLLGPAGLTVGAAGEVAELGSLQTGKLNALLSSAQPIKYPGDAWWGKGDPTGGAGQVKLWYRFEAEYCDKSKEFGELYTDGTGQINGRWFYTDPATIKEMGVGFSEDTSQVPDASRITPEPVKPGKRAGHNISVSVTIDTGGPGIVELKSTLHKLTGTDFLDDDEAPSKITVALADAKEIPNRDFVLSWRTSAETITEAKLTHAGENGGFFTLILQPPDRVEVADIPPRELIFVMDISGSMRGYPIEKSKEVIAKAIESMRPRDTFNVITFANGTSFLWDDPKPATADNRAAAQAFISSGSGGGGTEMMKAINAALVQTVGERPTPLTPRQLADLPADGRGVTILVACGKIRAMLPAEAEGHELTVTIHLCNGGTILVRGLQMHLHVRPGWQLVTGRWVTQGGRRVFTVDEVRHIDEAAAAKPMRIVLFLTDGYVGNDMVIIDAVKKNAHTTRVFSFGIGNSVNRYLLQGMANAGRGEAEFVLLESDSDAAVERFTKRIETPVLTDITLAFSDGLEVTDVIPPLDAVPDLFDVQPLVIHGRYTEAGQGTLTIAGNTGAGAYERTIELTFAEDQPEHDVIATLWARAKVEQIMNQDLAGVQQNNFRADLKQQVVALGEEFQIMTQYTSFVAVEKSRLTIDGQPVLVAVPIEMPSGVSYEGIFGGFLENAIVGEQIRAGLHKQGRIVAQLTNAFIGDSEVESTEAGTRVHRSERQRLINQNMGRVRQLQMELKYDEALGVVKEILSVDEHNPAAQALKEIINTTILYRKWDEAQRQKNRGYGQLVLEGEESKIAPVRNFTGPGLKSTSGVMASPPDWPNLTLIRTGEHGFRQAAADEVNALLSPAGTRVDIQQREMGLEGFDIGESKRTPPPGGLPSRASEQQLGNWVDQRKQTDDDARLPRNALRQRALRYSNAPGKRARGRDVKLDVNGALKQGVAGSGGFGGGGRRGGGIFGDPSDEKKRKNTTKGTITFPWQQTPQPAEGRYGFENTNAFYNRSGSSKESNGETPLLSGIPVLGDLFRYEGGDEKGLSSDDSLPRDDRADKDTVDRRVAGKVSLFDELKKLAEANKVDDQPAETDAPASVIAPADAGAAPPASEPADELVAAGLERVEAENSIEAIELPLLMHLFSRAGRPLLTNEVAIIIGQLVEADQIDTAKQLTDELLIYLPEYEIGVKMRDVLANDELDNEARKKTLIELALKAQAQLEAVMFQAWGEARLRNVLEASLYQTVVDASTDDVLLVSVLATSLDDDVLSAFKQAGLTVLAKPTSGSFVVGETSREKLVDLALLEAVRWIEPARLTTTRN